MTKIINGGIFVDDRGPLRFVNDFDFKDVKRFYQVENHERGFIRAWHGHKKEGKYVYVPRGSALIGVISVEDIRDYRVYANRTKKDVKCKKFVLSDKKPQILYIPPGNYNGFKTLEENTIVFFFSTSTMEETKDDDIRLDYYDFEFLNIDYR